MFWKKIFSPSKPDFLKDGEEAKVIWTEKKPPSKKKTGTFFTLRFKLRPIMVMMVVSMIIGAIAGGFAGYYGGTYFVTEFMTTSAQLNSSPVFSQHYQEQRELATISGENQPVEEIVEVISPSVVNIIVTKEVASYYNDPYSFDDFFRNWPSWPDNFFGPRIPEYFGPEQPQEEKKEKRQVGGGTGFVISSQKGLVLTNKHVVSDLEAEYTVTTNDGESFSATVLARDPFNDIAILQVENLNLPAVKLGDSDQIKIGQAVIAIGNALGEYRNTVTKGVISGISRKVIAGDAYGSSEILEDVIQTDAAINFGNSGGPLINLKGEVIGINTAINREGQLIGFAIPINQAKKAIESVEEYGYIVRPYIGVRYILLNPDIAEKNNLDIDYGALIVRGSGTSDLAVIPGSPANQAGLVENDIILEVDGQKITEDYSLSRIIQEHQPGDEIELKVYHQGEEKTVKVTLGEYKPSSS